MDLSQQIAILNNEIQRLKKLELFNASTENIVAVVEHNKTTFILTCHLIYDTGCKLSGINYNGYDLAVFKRESPKSYPLIKLMSYYEPQKLGYQANSLWIQELKVTAHKDMNKGYGSILFDHYLPYVRTLGVTYIRGDLSSVDDWNKDRRNHFYEKYGFVITGAKVELYSK